MSSKNSSKNKISTKSDQNNEKIKQVLKNWSKYFYVFIIFHKYSSLIRQK